MNVAAGAARGKLRGVGERPGQRPRQQALREPAASEEEIDAVVQEVPNKKEE